MEMGQIFEIQATVAPVFVGFRNFIYYRSLKYKEIQGYSLREN
jgi:hypothetical protein